MVSKRRAAPLPVGVALVGYLAAIAIPAVIAQLWWRDQGMCDSGFGCTRAGVYAAAPGVLIGGVLIASTYLRHAARRRSDVQPAMLVALAVAQLFFAAPTDGELNDGCNQMTGRTVRMLKADDGPFTTETAPILGPAAVTQMGCNVRPPDVPTWRWGEFEAGTHDGS